MSYLNWPVENTCAQQLTHNPWFHAGSNICLDFHGDPNRSELCVFSDGNHHMALEQGLNVFRIQQNIESIFYCTTPPKVYLDWLKAGSIRLGNLCLSIQPDLIIGPSDIIECQKSAGLISRLSIFAASQGISLLVKKGNPKNITRINDLFRKDIRIFLSNPVTEQASHSFYRQSILDQAKAAGITHTQIAQLFDHAGQIYFGQLIHHREAPQAIVDGQADVAVVYRHLALRYCRIFADIFDAVALTEANTTTDETGYAVGLVNEQHLMAQRLYQFIATGGMSESYQQHGLKPLLQNDVSGQPADGTKTDQ